MVSDERVKTYIFPAAAITGSNTIHYTDNSQSINGVILKVRFEGIKTAGSVFLGESGGIPFWFKRDFASGDATSEIYPGLYTVDSTNTTGSPWDYIQPVVNAPLFWGTSGATSGTSITFGPVTVYYR